MPWCATTPDFDEDGKWGNCICEWIPRNVFFDKRGGGGEQKHPISMMTINCETAYVSGSVGTCLFVPAFCEGGGGGEEGIEKT